MALGDRLVRELGLTPDVDTLGRWMAHHLAELIEETKRKIGPEREAAQVRVVDLILKLWSRRADLPGGANPLNDLKSVLVALDRLGSGSSPFNSHFGRMPEQLLSKVFTGLQLIVAHGLILTVSDQSACVDAGEATTFLSEEELRVLDAINLWIKSFRSARVAKISFVITERDENSEVTEAERAAVLELDEWDRARLAFVSEIDDLIGNLNALKDYLAVDAGKS